MLKVIVDNQWLFVLMGIFVAVGIISKLIVSITLKKMVKAASDMSKSSHALMRLVRAKFEHACMASDKVQNIEVFAQKYLYEYKVLGIRLHRLQRMEMGSVWGCLALGVLGAFAAYRVYGMSETSFRLGATGAIEAMLLFLLHKITDEKYQLEMVKTYMVDYLENVCTHRLEKAMKKEEKKAALEYERDNPELENPERPRPRNEVPSPFTKPELTPPAMPEPNPLPEAYPVPEVTQPKVLMNKKQEEKKEKTQVAKDVRIREILEEFLA